MGFHFSERACRVYIYTAWVLKSQRMKPKFSAYFEPKEHDYGRVLHELESRLVDRAADIHPAPLLEMLRNVLDRWIEHVLGPDEMEPHRMQVVPLASRWRRWRPVKRVPCFRYCTRDSTERGRTDCPRWPGLM